MVKRIIVLPLLTFLLFPSLGIAEQVDRLEPNRFALVIGNGAYQTAPLKNSVNDANDMAGILRSLGFTVILKVNASQKTMKKAIREFGQNIRKKGGVGLFYYSGHGIQIKGTNYLIPTDIHIESEADVEYDAVNTGLVLGKMEDAGNAVNIVILDACRDNPFTRSFRTASRGLARMDAPKGTLIVYSTAPGSVAADGRGRNGTYTKYLLQYITNPGLKVEEVLKRIRLDVINETNNKQVPWESSSMTGEFYFSGQPGISAQATSKRPPLKPRPPKPIIKEDATLKKAIDYYTGTTGRVDEKKAKALFLKASEGGNSLATMWLAHFYHKGICRFPVDEVRAQLLAEKVIEQVKSSALENLEQSMFLLASAYLDGLGVPPDAEKAVSWYRKAAERGSVVAMHYLGLMYDEGRGINPDYEKAAFWYRKAAEKGFAEAMYNLGVMYEGGAGIAQDYEKAIFWYRKAAGKGLTSAMTQLGTMYHLGHGVPTDYTKASYWFQKAEAKGDISDRNYLLKRAKPGCFIATAAYGTERNKQVNTLRLFRNKWLSDNTLGTWFIQKYYRISPSIADAIAERTWLQPIVRTALVPVVMIAGAFLGRLPDILSLFFLTTGTTVCFLLYRKRSA